MNKILSYRVHVSVLFILSVVLIVRRLNMPPLPTSILMALGSWHWSLYLYNRVTDAKEDGISQSGEDLKDHKERAFVRVLATILLLWPLPWLFLNGMNGWVYLFLVPIGWLYSIRLFNGFRIKQILGIKNLYSAVFCWTLPMCLAVTQFGSVQVSLYRLTLIALEMLGVVTIYEIIWDVRDMRGDREARVRTIANTFGPSAARWSAFSVLALLVFMKWNLDRQGTLFILLYFGFFILLVHRERSPWFYHSMILGQVLVSAVFWMGESQNMSLFSHLKLR